MRFFIAPLSGVQDYDRFFKPFSGKKINLPEKYDPGKEFLEYHRDIVFRD
jgi:hypothetical protein